MSDLHLEMIANSDYIKTKEFEVCGDVLVLAGDIIYLRDIAAVYNGFWDWATRNYQRGDFIVNSRIDYWIYGHSHTKAFKS